MTVSRIRVQGVNLDKLQEFVGQRLSGTFRYRANGFSCVTETSRALLHAGVLNLPVLRHPMLLQLQMAVRNGAIYAPLLGY